MNDMRFNRKNSRERRDNGADIALAHERAKWRLKATLLIIANFPKGWEGLAEEFQPVVAAKIGPPHVPQVWGALALSLVRTGWFEHTDRHDQCAMNSNHARHGRILRKMHGHFDMGLTE
jgi:hypothetical protein